MPPKPGEDASTADPGGARKTTEELEREFMSKLAAGKEARKGKRAAEKAAEKAKAGAPAGPKGAVSKRPAASSEASAAKKRLRLRVWSGAGKPPKLTSGEPGWEYKTGRLYASDRLGAYRVVVDKSKPANEKRVPWGADEPNNDEWKTAVGHIDKHARSG